MKAKTLPAMLALLVLTSARTQVNGGGTSPPNGNQPAVQRDNLSAAMQGSRLTEKQAKELETKLIKNPEDLETRMMLLGYYQRAQFSSADGRQARQTHILWLIEHHPDVNIHAPFIGMDKILDGSAYEQAKTLWLKQVRDHPKDLTILENAADFLLLQERGTAEDLLKQAQSMEPDNTHWAEKLAELYNLDANSGDATAAANALTEMEKVHAGNPGGDFDHLGNLAKMSFAAGETAKAKTYATELLQQAPSHKQDWNYGNAIHDGNMILGRLAVREGKLEDAKRYLREAGKTPGSPQLNSFGPNMSLAKDLLEKGAKEDVVNYFQSCSKFWTMGAGKLKQWTGEVNAGKVPDFGANLVY